jgi:hypothetical protein
MIDWKRLQREMPSIVSALCDMMVDEALPLMAKTEIHHIHQNSIFTPSVTITFRPRDGGEGFRVTLMVEPDNDDEDHSEEDDSEED